MRICIIGHFGGNKCFNDGQTVKTKTLYNALEQRDLQDVGIDTVDTYYIKHNPLKFCWVFFCCLLRDKKIVVLLSKNGRNVLFPVLYFMSKILKKEIYHYAIGGRLAKEIEKKPRWKDYVNSFKGNWVESRALAERLQLMGVKNAIYLPNFKSLSVLSEEELIMHYDAPYKFCIFSRVMAEKGVEDAIDAVLEVNSRYDGVVAELDIYGPIEEGYEDRLEECLRKTNGVCRYCGIVPANESVEVLKEYYALLFPTHWRHEGIPGTIIDALSAGIPVISRRWQYCDEMITNKETGYVYEFEQPEQLIELIWYAITNYDETMKMKANCLARANGYSEAHVIKKIIEKLELEL